VHTGQRHHLHAVKKTIALGLVAGLAALSLASPASAGKKTFKHTFFLHGPSQAGEADLPNTWLDSAWLPMDPNEPEGSAPKSMFVTNYLVGPNTACSGNGLLPTWKGLMAGTVKGNLTVSLQTIGSPAAKVQIDIFPDATGGCDSDLGSTGYVPPVASAVVDVPPGPGVTEVTFKKVNFKVGASLVMMLSIPGAPANPQQVRVLYDSSDFASAITLTCSGKPCV
jgi:hypothetical protein